MVDCEMSGVWSSFCLTSAAVKRSLCMTFRCHWSCIPKRAGSEWFSLDGGKSRVHYPGVAACSGLTVAHFQSSKGAPTRGGNKPLPKCSGRHQGAARAFVLSWCHLRRPYTTLTPQSPFKNLPLQSLPFTCGLNSSPRHPHHHSPPGLSFEPSVSFLDCSSFAPPSAPWESVSTLKCKFLGKILLNFFCLPHS